MKFTLGFSPCPNDCFIFDALIHHKIDTEGLEFDVVLEDVEALNSKAFKGELDITKLSYHAFAHLTNTYALCNAGSALGKNCGPLLVALQPISKEILNEGKLSIAIPGKYTTANFLLSLFYPQAANKTAVLFSDIEEAVLSKKFDAGLIIHENRFTYADRGLTKLLDLGEEWESATQAPIPLGGIVVNRKIQPEIQQQFDRLLKKSIAFAFENPKESAAFVKQHAQAMSEEVMYKHIALYVNEFSLDLGSTGKSAVQLMLQKAQTLGIIPPLHPEIFV